MNVSGTLLLFLFGVGIGSFLNVLILRYDERRSLFSIRPLLGRSRCPRCGNRLAWHELIPFVSFLIQRGKCRSCRKPISIQYPVVELLAGLIVATVPAYVADMFVQFAPAAPAWLPPAAAAAWIGIFLLLLCITVIDIRKRIIPDEAVAGVALLACAAVAAKYALVPFASFIGPYAALFGLQERIILGSAAGTLFGTVLFGALIIATRGRGMGMGDMKLAAAIGFALGWPDGAIALLLSFMAGTLFFLPFLAMRAMGAKNAVPFGPFMAVAAGIVFFFGDTLARGYIALFGII